MKNKILSIFVLLMFMVCNIVYASGEAFYDVEFKYSDNGIMTVSGKLSEGEDRLIYIDVTDNSGESVYTDMTYSAYDGKFVFVMDVEEWEKGEYLFSFCDEGANRYSVSMTNPFKESDSDVGYDILNNEIWFEDEYEPDKTKNIIEIDFYDAEFMQGKVNEEFYSIDGLPKGIKTIAEAEENKLLITFYGKADKPVREEKDLTVTLKPGINLSSGGTETVIDGIVIIPFEIAKSVRYTTDNMVFKMKNNTQPADDSNFEITLKRDIIVSGELEKGVHFDYSEKNIDGLKVKAYVSASENKIKVELSGTSRDKITKDLYIENFVLKSVIAEGANQDSSPEKIKIIAKKGTQPSGGGSGGGTGGGATGGNVTGGSGTTGGGLTITGGAGNNVQNIITTDKDSVEATVPDKVVEFSDMTSHWAKGEVKFLAGKGIINGIGNNMFAPDRSVTRAEFLKMIVSAFDMKAEGVMNCFADVDSSDWFYTYVLAGLKNGIISEDVNFRPNDTISRQEMSKIATEAVLKNVSAPEILISSKTYADFADISDWAIEYVEKGSTLGLFKGDEMQRFLPKDNTTRAAAAVVVYRALSYNGM